MNSTPIAVVEGKAVEKLPPSLFVPPDAMRVFLASFEGPLDLLHYLIKRERMDVKEILMAELLKQYLVYVDEIVARELELAADYLTMSAALVEIKSLLLLRRSEEIEEEEEDPRAKLVERLLYYSRISKAGRHLHSLPLAGRDCWQARIAIPPLRQAKMNITAPPLRSAMLAITARTRQAAKLEIGTDSFSIREAMTHLFLRLRRASSWVMSRLLGKEHATKMRVGIFFQAVLQMAKEELVHVDQHDSGDIQVSPKTGKPRSQA